MNQLIEQTWRELPTRRELHQRLERLEMPADAKVAIAELISVTSTAGDRVLEVGRRIVAFAFELVRQFPNLAFCTVIALVMNALIAAVPLLGPLLSALLGPILLVVGVGLGALLELREGDMRERIDLLTREFQAIFA